MRKNIALRKLAGLSALVLLGLAGCGGGNESLSTKSSVDRVYVMGDSLADVGTFGYKFTVQDSSSSKGFQVWPQIVAGRYGLDGSAQCNFFAFTGSTFGLNTAAGCTNYAIGGGQIVVPASKGGSASPQTINTQMATKAAAGHYTGTELVLIDGGGNDAADMVGAYLALGQTQNLGNYQAFLAQQLDSATIGALLPQTNGPALAAGAYMVALANTFSAQIKANVLDKGAKKVAVLDMPDITLTPRFGAVLAGVAAQGGDATALRAAIQSWIGAYNSQLQTALGNDDRVVIAPFYADFTDEVSNPTAYQLTDVTHPACPAVGTGSDGLPIYDFPNCSSTALDTTLMPSGKTAGWWKSYAFSDGFHPTPYGHQLLAASVSRALARKGWL